MISRLLILLSIISINAHSLDSRKIELLRGRKNSDGEKISWDKKFSSDQYVFGKDPADSLTKYIKFLPKKKLKVLDLAMSEGRNTIFMAKKGHDVTGIDISSVAIKKANALAKENNVNFKGIISDLTKYEFGKHEFDVILCYYFLDRNLITKIKNWVKPGGYIIFENFTVNDPVESRKNKKYLLLENELISLFEGERLIYFQELIHTNRRVSSIVIQKK
jgi:tellurite methyltransferase